MFDAIVVGARCAGSPTAMLLARRGYRVLLLDRARFPSDTISTLVVWPHGAEILDRWGLLDGLVATGCPPVARNMVFDIGPFALEGAVADANRGRGGYCPRRTVLDKLLADAAVESGAELREEVAVEELVWHGDRVAGLRGQRHGGGSFEERARVVIGADGVHSLVAKAVGAPEYDAKPPLATYYYSYYSGFDADDVEQYLREDEAAACFPTHDGLTLIAAAWPSRRFPEVRSDIERHVREVHEAMPGVGERLQAARREERWVGTAGVANFFRKPYGPGWALVGDAGYTKDPVTAYGIMDAFLSAERLTAALIEWLSGAQPYEDAMTDYQRDRDVHARPSYELTCDFATLALPPPETQQLLHAVSTNAETMNEFVSMMTGTLPVPEFFAPTNVERIISAASA